MDENFKFKVDPEAIQELNRINLEIVQIFGVMVEEAAIAVAEFGKQMTDSIILTPDKLDRINKIVAEICAAD